MVSRLSGDTPQGLSMRRIPASEGLTDAKDLKAKITGEEAYRTGP